MALSAANIRQAIVDVLEGSSGTYTAVLVGKFVNDVVEGMTDDALGAKVLQTSTADHHFDVVLGPLTTHEASPQANRSSSRIAQMLVTLPVYSRLPTTTETATRDTALGAFASDLEDAAQALGTPGNLTATAAAGTTNIISGLMRGLDNRGMPDVVIEEMFDKRWMRAEIRGSILLTIARTD